jgi:hypothetical protein
VSEALALGVHQLALRRRLESLAADLLASGAKVADTVRKMTEVMHSDFPESAWLPRRELIAIVAAFAGARASDPRPIIVRISDVKAEEVAFLFDPYIALRKLTLLEGDPGLGKTWFALAIAAAVSRGYPLPGPDGKLSQPTSPAQVLYLTAEDGIGDTLRPRLEAAGADLGRVQVLAGQRGEDGREGIVTLADLPILEQALEQVQPALVVVDPIQGFLGAGVDMHRANEVRPLLAGLARLAERYSFAALLVRHLRKSSAERAVHRGLGSIDFAAAVRSILLVAEDPEAPSRRIVAHAKSNLAPAGVSQVFEIREGRFVWSGTSPLRADDLLAPPSRRKAPREEEKTFLRRLLASGAVEQTEVLRQGLGAGFSEKTLRRAKDDIGVRARRRGAPWVWELTEDDRQGGHDGHVDEGGHLRERGPVATADDCAEIEL